MTNSCSLRSLVSLFGEAKEDDVQHLYVFGTQTIYGKKDVFFQPYTLHFGITSYSVFFLFQSWKMTKSFVSKQTNLNAQDFE